MSPLIETLNRLGAQFLAFAGPMLWQSSLLILIVMALDFALRRKLPAAVRYALWLVVLVKLLLPPALALPSSAAWWLRSSPSARVAAPERRVVVTYSVPSGRVASSLSSPTIIAPPATLTFAGGLFVASVAIALCLLTWMLHRWLQVMRSLRKTVTPPAVLDELLTEAKRRISLRAHVTLRLVDQPISPAVCGLWRPVVLLPRPLVGRLTTQQMRAVLLHELVHVNRGDIWLNCAQTLLQIAYWWHPLLWLANARIRRAREEAVDDAVMLALDEEAGHYAPTLLEVARLVFTRPLAGLGLIGILESRSALRQRIERLTGFVAPRKTGLGVVSFLCIATFAALALPMAERPEAETNGPADSSLHERASSTPPTTEIMRMDKLVILPSLVSGQSNGTASIQITSDQLSVDKATGEMVAEGHVRMQRDNPAASDTPETGSDASPPVETNLLTRVYKVDTQYFTREVQRLMGVPTTNKTDLDGETVRNFFSAAGVNLRPPKAVFYSVHGGLFVRATQADLDIIDNVITMLNISPPQVEIKVKFIELPANISLAALNSTASGAFTNIPGESGVSGILTPNRARAFLAQCEAQSGAILTASPEVTTLSDRQARISVVDVMSIVKGLSREVTNGSTNMVYDVTNEEFGPILDVVPHVSVDTHSIQLTVTPTVMEFLGYDDSKRDDLHVGVRPPLPRYRKRQITTSATVWDGQTLVLGGLMTEDVARDAKKLPVLGDVPGVGRAFRRETAKTVTKNLIVLITPTIIDSTGKRLNTDVGRNLDKDW